MRLRLVQLKAFKRFDDLTIDLGTTPARIVALVGPNGCGKSSIFDAFEERQKESRQADAREEVDFFYKALYSALGSSTNQYRQREAIQLTFDPPASGIPAKAFHIRSAYRFTATLNVTAIQSQRPIEEDRQRPTSSIALDRRLEENYQRLLGAVQEKMENEGHKTFDQVRNEVIGRINQSLESVLDIRISSLGNVLKGKGHLSFSKGDTKDFPYKNLSSGEKEVVDMIIDLVVRTPSFDDTVYCIDEPELHLNTAIQRRLLVELEKLIPEKCQLWVATHSIGFLRALQDELKGKAAILDFGASDLFSGQKTIKPMVPTRANWQRVFATALDDLNGLLAPRRIFYCEGRKEPDDEGNDQGLDADCFNTIFANAYPDTLFVSSGGRTEPKLYGSIALQVLQKAFRGVDLLLLKDRDRLTGQQRTEFLAESPHHRMLERHEIENYLLDEQVLAAYCQANSREFDRKSYRAIVTDINTQDLKAGSTVQDLKHLSGFGGSNDEFKRELAKHIHADSAVYQELENCVILAFGGSRRNTPADTTPVPTQTRI